MNIKIVLCFAALLAPFLNVDGHVLAPTYIKSSDGVYSISILKTTLPGYDPHDGFHTLSLVSHGNILMQYPTQGFALGALWGPDGKYVAVDTYNASYGDYLWVISLSDGKAVRTPDDTAVQPFVDRIVKAFPECASLNFIKRRTIGEAWKTPNEYIVSTVLMFSHFDVGFKLIDTYKIVDGKSVFESGAIYKTAPW